jgi:sugar/nucleoside kinase (ribokinase family)
MSGVLTSGNIVLDLLVRPVDDVTWGVTRWVDSIDQSLGGNGANTSSAIARMGVRSTLLGMLGRDPFGDACHAMLANHGVDLSRLVRAGSATATSIVLIQSNGARTFLHRPGVSREVFAGGVPLISGYSHYHLANVFALPNLRPNAAAVLAEAHRMGMTTSLDTAWDARGEWMGVLAPCLRHLDILFVNEDEARMLSGSTDPSTNASLFLSKGVGAFVIKLGAAGCVVYAEGHAWRVPAYPAHAVDTTGAGDCFAGAFLAARAKGLDWESSARLANAVGAMVVEHVGATTGLRSWEETLAWQRANAV